MTSPPNDLQRLLPKAIGWAEAEEARILAGGEALTAAQSADARRLGVVQPDRVRLLSVPCVPLPADPELRAAVEGARVITPATIGLTLRHGIFVREDFRGDRHLVAHELVHTAQYERLGGIPAFLQAYLQECLTPPGYPHGPLEQEAIQKSEALLEHTKRRH